MSSGRSRRSASSPGTAVNSDPGPSQIKGPTHLPRLAINQPYQRGVPGVGLIATNEAADHHYFADGNPVIRMGRSPEADFRSDSRLVSRRSFTLHHEGGKWLLKVDDQVGNLLVNGQKVEKEIPLKPGDRIRIENLHGAEWRFTLYDGAIPRYTLDRGELLFLLQNISPELKTYTEAVSALLGRPELARTRLGLQIVQKLLSQISLEECGKLLPLLDRAGLNIAGALKTKGAVESGQAAPDIDESRVPLIPVTVPSPPPIERHGGAGAIIYGGTENMGFSQMIPQTGEVVKSGMGIELRYNTSLQRYEYKTEKSDWREMAIGQNVATGEYARYMLLQISGVATDPAIDAGQDLQHQLRFQLATEGVRQHLLDLKRRGKGINDVDAQNLSFLFDPSVDRAFKAFSSGSLERTAGGFQGGTSTAYLFVDPITGKILKACEDVPTAGDVKAQGGYASSLRWSVVENPNDLNRPYWFERNRGFWRPVSLDGVPPGSIVVPITIQRMTGRIVMETPRSELAHLGLSEEAIRRMSHIDNAIVRPGSAIAHGLRKYVKRTSPSSDPLHPVAPLQKPVKGGSGAPAMDDLRTAEGAYRQLRRLKGKVATGP
ncbi:MAG: FHA domain-containing protein, partial [Deltaproteobacteria bacterium]|nr:FHA domain-containing protein [Deltaproteobacteria bacterium]